MSYMQISQALRFTEKITQEIAVVRAERAVTVALAIGGAYATLLTPVDTSFLRNSQMRKVEVRGSKVIGAVIYTAKYALAVHNAKGTLKGKPRGSFGKTKDGREFGGGTGNGNYWDIGGEPGFLKKGFNNNLDKIDAAVKKAFKI